MAREVVAGRYSDYSEEENGEPLLKALGCQLLESARAFTTAVEFKHTQTMVIPLTRQGARSRHCKHGKLASKSGQSSCAAHATKRGKLKVRASRCVRVQAMGSDQEEKQPALTMLTWGSIGLALGLIGGISDGQLQLARSRRHSWSQDSAHISLSGLSGHEPTIVDKNAESVTFQVSPDEFMPEVR